MIHGIIRVATGSGLLLCAMLLSAAQNGPAEPGNNANGPKLTFDRTILDYIDPTNVLANADGPIMVDRTNPAPKPARQSLQETLNLTKQEAEFLSTVVADYQSRNNAFAEAMKPLRREAMFQSLEDRQTSATLEQKISDLQRDREAMIASEIEMLKDRLGDSRLLALNDYFRAMRERPAPRKREQ